MTDLIRPEPKSLYALKLREASGEIETFHATDDHPWKVEGRGWVETQHLKAEDRIDTASGQDMVVGSLGLTNRVEHTYNLEIADWHTFLVGEDHAVVHNAGPCKLRPDLIATGSHTTYKRGGDGRVTGYQSWHQNSKNPSGWDAGDRFRSTGKMHGGVAPPLVISPSGRARPASPHEIPR